MREWLPIIFVPFHLLHRMCGDPSHDGLLHFGFPLLDHLLLLDLLSKEVDLVLSQIVVVDKEGFLAAHLLGWVQSGLGDRDVLASLAHEVAANRSCT